jgi:hypothetical protein
MAGVGGTTGGGEIVRRSPSGLVEHVFAPPTGSAPLTLERPATEVQVVPAELSRWQVEDLVDVVVERIERRVVDELERRGRRHHPGVF